MSPSQVYAMILALIEQLRERGSWCGETHVQKAAYVLEEVLGVPLNLRFVLYKHGPYSFDLSDHLEEMKAMSLIRLAPQRYPYGPKIMEAESAKIVLKMYSKTVSKHQQALEAAANLLDAKGVAELERLTTALVVLRELGDVDSSVQVGKMLDYKPHVEASMAEIALEEAKDFLRKVRAEGKSQQ